MRRCLPLLLLAAAASAADDRVRVTLTDGRVVEGVLERRDDDGVRVRVQRRSADGGGFSAAMTWPAAVVAAVDPIDLEPEYRARAEACADAEAHAALAVWCRENGLAERAIEHARRALALDPASAVARRELAAQGFSEVDGRWLSPEEVLAAGGRVVGGKVMTAEEADRVTALAAARGSLTRVERDLRRERDAIAALDRELQQVEDEARIARRELPAALAERERARAGIEVARTGLLAARREAAAARPRVVTQRVERRTVDDHPVVILPVRDVPPPTVDRVIDPYLGAAGVVVTLPEPVVVPLPRRGHDHCDDDGTTIETTTVVDDGPVVAAQAVLATAEGAAQAAAAALAVADRRVAELDDAVRAGDRRPAEISAKRERHVLLAAELERRRDELDERIVSLTR